MWTWNGWEFDAPVSRIVVIGSGILEGFLWTDDLEMTPVPAPAGVLPLLLLAGAMARGRRRGIW